jgi:hypothetical protein
VIKVKHLLIVVLAGSVWGISEAVAGGFLYAREVPYAAVMLSLVGLVVLSLARFLVPIRGTSLAIAAIALGYRWLNVGYFPCHLSAILCLGGTFEILASAMGLERLKERSFQALVGGGTGVLGFALFAGIMTAVAKSPYWTGVPGKVSTYLLSGLMMGAMGLALVPAAYQLGRRVSSWVDSAVTVRPVAAFGVSSLVILACWLTVF